MEVDEQHWCESSVGSVKPVRMIKKNNGTGMRLRFSVLAEIVLRQHI